MNDNTNLVPQKMPTTELMQAASKGATEEVERKLSQAGTQDSNGRTALMKAARGGYASCVRLLLSQEARIQDYLGWTALMKAAEKGHADCTELLIPAEAKMQDKKGWTALILAAYYGHASCVERLLLEAGIQKYNGFTALMCAAQNGHADCVRLLLTKEAGIKHSKGQTSLMSAAVRGHLDCVRLLIPHEGRLQNGDGWTALMFAAQHDHPDCVRALLDVEAGMADETQSTALMKAAISGHIDCVNILVDKESCLRNAKGQTALIETAIGGNASCVRVLIPKEAGARDSYSMTALMWAVVKNNLECAEFLLSEAGITTTQEVSLDVGSRSITVPEGSTALIIAAILRALPFVELLKPFEVGVTDLDGHNARWHATVRNYGEIMEKLGEEAEGADAKAPSPHTHMTALMRAAIAGKAEVVRQHIGELGMQDSHGWTALMHAAENGRIGCVKLLLSEAEIINAAGETALEIASVSGQEDPRFQARCTECLRLIQEHLDGTVARKAMHQGDNLHALSVASLPPSDMHFGYPGLDNKYSIIESIGTGSFGEVFAVRDVLNRCHAVKRVPYTGFQPSTRKGLQMEMDQLPNLRHEGILRYLSVHDDVRNKHAYFVMELCIGDLAGEIDKRLDAGTSFSDAEVWRYVGMIADALLYLHTQNLVHRDLKPANILIDRDGNCKLGDFGLVRATNATQRAATVCGTFFYQAPELLEGGQQTCSGKIDVWSLGVIAYELCTLRKPFCSGNIGTLCQLITEKEPTPITDRSADLVALIKDMIIKDPAVRPPIDQVYARLMAMRMDQSRTLSL
ncbi:Kinase, NEK [Giardia muris]|uniref:Kinase, NEK n=1 Tax=Giardia muris TaxID=5742 RepID=A0A4Z1SNH6_GIAMU|nr:Kinase, NEK [Giardia muris]|eukprot:TNJ27306.1 Kinase, NEK [Giardia muris]